MAEKLSKRKGPKERDLKSVNEIVRTYSDPNKERKYKGMTYNSRDGSVLVTDMVNQEVCRVDLASERIVPLFKLRDAGNAVNGISVTHEGLIAVSDYYKQNIHLYSPDSYEFVKPFTTDELKGPNGLAVSDKGHVFVAESNRKAVGVFDGNGSSLYRFGTSAPAGEAKEGKFVWPYQICIPSDGLVYVSDTQGSRIQVFEQDGTHIRDIGGGITNGPGGISMSAEGYLVASSIRSQSVYFFTVNGRLVHEFKKCGVPESHGLAVNQAGSIFMADYTNKRVVEL